MVEGAEAWCGAKPAPRPLIGAGAVAIVVFPLDVTALSVGEIFSLRGRGPGSKGGRSIAFPDVG
jgi:hypothetical protein